MTRFESFCCVLIVMLAAASRPGVARAEGREPRQVFLEIQGATDQVRVLQRDPWGRARPVCTGRCESSLDQGPEYLLETRSAFIPAPLFTSSRAFTLPPDRPRVLLDVTPVSKVRPAAGWSLVAVGIAAVLVSTAGLMGDNPGGPMSNLGTPSRYWLAVYPLGFAAAGLGGYLLDTSNPRVTSDTGAVLQR